MYLGRREKVRIVGDKPLVSLRLQGEGNREILVEDCVMDTGCFLPIVLPPTYAGTVRRLSSSYPIDAQFPDGTEIPGTTFFGEIKWLCDRWRRTAIGIAESFRRPLLGLPLLKDSVIVLRKNYGHARPRWWVVSDDIVES